MGSRCSKHFNVDINVELYVRVKVPFYSHKLPPICMLCASACLTCRKIQCNNTIIAMHILLYCIHTGSKPNETSTNINFTPGEDGILNNFLCYIFVRDRHMVRSLFFGTLPWLHSSFLLYGIPCGLEFSYCVGSEVLVRLKEVLR